MNKIIYIPILLLSALAIAVVAGLGIYQGVNAAAPILSSKTITDVHHRGIGGGLGGGYTHEDLAAALGITIDELDAAYEAATTAALAQAVDQELITQAQADQLAERGFVFPFGNRWGNWLSENGIDFDAHLADALEISVDELQDARTEAVNARIDAAVANGRITEEQADLLKGQRALFSNDGFLSSMQSAFEAAVQQAVEAGVITQSQADRILENFPGFGMRGFKGMGEFKGLEGFPGFHGFGGFPGFGRHGGRLGDLPGDEAPSVTPEVNPTGGF